jgi:hypothetical protein
VGRTCPLPQLQGDPSIATARAACDASASEDVTAVTGYSSCDHYFLDAPIVSPPSVVQKLTICEYIEAGIL